MTTPFVNAWLCGDYTVQDFADAWQWLVDNNKEFANKNFQLCMNVSYSVIFHSSKDSCPRPKHPKVMSPLLDDKNMCYHPLEWTLLEWATYQSPTYSQFIDKVQDLQAKDRLKARTRAEARRIFSSIVWGAGEVKDSNKINRLVELFLEEDQDRIDEYDLTLLSNHAIFTQYAVKRYYATYRNREV